VAGYMFRYNDSGVLLSAAIAPRAHSGMESLCQHREAGYIFHQNDGGVLLTGLVGCRVLRKCAYVSVVAPRAQGGMESRQ
jgi:hypothetical protein